METYSNNINGLNIFQGRLTTFATGKQMHPDSIKYNEGQIKADREICDRLAQTIESALPEAESKFWHAHPVWFLDGNPVVGYGKLKSCIRLLFWSGQSFQTRGLKQSGSFKAAEIRYCSVEEINTELLESWLNESCSTQWDYKNIVKRKGKLVRLG